MKHSDSSDAQLATPGPDSIRSEKEALLPWHAFLPGVLLLALGTGLTSLGGVGDYVVAEFPQGGDSTGPIQCSIYIPIQDDGPLPGVLLAHGINNNKETMEPLALELVRRGLVAMTFDFGGHGASYRREHDTDRDAEDLRRALATLADHPRVDPEQLAIVGHSIGARAAVEVARGDDRVRAVVATSMSIDAGPQRPDNLLLAAGIYDQCHAPRYLLEDLRRATGDGASAAETVYGSFAQGTARQLCLSPQTDHLLAPYDPRLIQATAEWIERSLARSPDQTLGVRTHRLAAARSCLIAGAGLLVFLLTCARPGRRRHRWVAAKFRRLFALLGGGAVLLPVAYCWAVGGSGGLWADLSMVVFFSLLATNLLLRTAVANEAWIRKPAASLGAATKLVAIVFLAWWFSVVLGRVDYLWRTPQAVWSVGAFGAEVLGLLPHHLLLKLRAVLFVNDSLLPIPSAVLVCVLLVEVLIPGELLYVVFSVLGAILRAMRIRRRQPVVERTSRSKPSRLVRLRQVLLLAVLSVLLVALCRRLASAGPEVRLAMGQLALRMFVLPLVVVFVLVNVPWLGRLSADERR